MRWTCVLTDESTSLIIVIIIIMIVIAGQKVTLLPVVMATVLLMHRMCPTMDGRYQQSTVSVTFCTVS